MQRVKKISFYEHFRSKSKLSVLFFNGLLKTRLKLDLFYASASHNFPEFSFFFNASTDVISRKAGSVQFEVGEGSTNKMETNKGDIEDHHG